MPRLSVCRLRALFGPRQGPSVLFLLPGKEAGSEVSGMEGRQTKRRANIIISGGSRVIPTTDCPQATPSAPWTRTSCKREFSRCPFPLPVRHGIAGNAGLQFPRDVCLTKELPVSGYGKNWKNSKNQGSGRVRGIHATFSSQHLSNWYLVTTNAFLIARRSISAPLRPTPTHPFHSLAN